MPQTIHRRYVVLTLCCLLAFCAPLVLLNSAVDPLWHFDGNKITGRNYPIDERTSKTNLFLNNMEKYECIIFGSSRTTLMPAGAFPGLHCFNLAFSSGKIEEFIEFARYIKNLGFSPKTIIIGVDGFNFLAQQIEKPSIPEFIVDRARPTTFLKDYLSFGALKMSFRTLINDFPPGRFYDRNFDCRINPDAPKYRPYGKNTTEGLERTDSDRIKKISYDGRKTELYAALNDVFPQSKVYAYVPPISAWRIEALSHDGVLDSYIDALYDVTQVYPHLVDFSVPSDVTVRTDNTYDGSHYSPTVNSSIAATLLEGSTPVFGIPVSTLSRIQYHERYREALSLYAREIRKPQDSKH